MNGELRRTNIPVYPMDTVGTSEQLFVNGKLVAQRLSKNAYEVYINHIITQATEEGDQMCSANYVRVEGELTYSNIVNAFVTTAYTASERESALRKGVANSADEDYAAFNGFAESIKNSVAWAKTKEVYVMLHDTAM